MSDIFNEIDEDIRRERLGRLWRRFGPAIIAFAVLFVAAIGGWRYYEHRAEQQAHEAGERYAAALDLAREGNRAEAEPALRAVAEEGPEGYAVLARFRAATELAENDPAGAIAAFEAITQDGSVSPLLRDFARVRAGYLMVETGNAADVSSRVEALAGSGGAFRHSAREIMALAQWKAGDVAETRRWAQDLVADVEAPAGARTRGQILLDLASGADQPDIVPPVPAAVPDAVQPAEAPVAVEPAAPAADTPPAPDAGEMDTTAPQIGEDGVVPSPPAPDVAVEEPAVPAPDTAVEEPSDAQPQDAAPDSAPAQ
jgi:hypothetical protein